MIRVGGIAPARLPLVAHYATMLTQLLFRGAVAIATMSAAVVVPHGLVEVAGRSVDSRTLLLIAAMALWGISEGNGPVVESIFADSVPTGAPTVQCN